MMLTLRRTIVRFPRNVIHRPLSDVVKWKTVKLNDRALVRVTGEESSVFLQGLITNDISSLESKEVPSIYCMFLNTGGRVLFDAIVSPGFEPNQFLVEVDQKLSKTVIKHLSMYKVRRKIRIEAEKDLCVSAIFHGDLAANTDRNLQTRSSLVGSTFCDGGTRESLLPDVSDSNSICFPDPRVDLLGYRYIGADSDSIKNKISIDTEEGTAEDYVRQRCWAGVAEGSQEILPAKALPIEYNVDYLHGVSFHKGCYIGQELTARTHHTGVIRKRILPLKFASDDAAVQFDTDISNDSGKSVGKIRKTQGRLGLAMVRLQEAFSASQLMCGGVPVSVWKPDWWPQDKAEDAKKELN